MSEITSNNFTPSSTNSTMNNRLRLRQDRLITPNRNDEEIDNIDGVDDTDNTDEIDESL